MPLTDVKCRNAKGKASAYKLSDGGGLHLLVNADGAKYWRLAYRWHGKQRTLSLGVYPAVGSCPLAWCSWRRVTAFAGKSRAGQLAIAGRLTVGSSLNGAMVSSVM